MTSNAVVVQHAAITSAALERGLEVLVQASAGNRRLRGAAARLLTDLAAVASGLRPAFMLDYATLEPEALAVAVASTLRELQTATALCVAVLQDCCLVVNAAALPRDAPRFISFAPRAGSDGAAAVQWASQDQSAALQGQLEGVRRALVAAAAVAPAGGPAPILSLDALPHAVCMPTLAGYLLGYPAVYAVSSPEAAQAASRCLSCTTLRLFTATATLGGLEPRHNNDNSDGHLLLGFSVPDGLAKGNAWQAAMGRWRAGMLERHASALGSGYPWRRLQFHEKTCMQGVAL